MANAADFLPPDLQALLPETTTPIQLALLQACIQHTCVASRGKGPIVGTNEVASSDCRICFDTLEDDDLTIRHDHQAAVGVNDPTKQPCGRTYHAYCLVEWMANAVQLGRDVDCPTDRQTLIPRDVSQAIDNQFNVREVQHDFRRIDSVVEFWRNADPNADNPPTCSFAIQESDLVEVLRMATIGMDVGFITSDVVVDLPLDQATRDTFDEYDGQTQRLSGRDRYGRNNFQYTYKYWAYLHEAHEMTNVDTGAELHRFRLVPMDRTDYNTFRRYLTGLLGEVWSVRMDSHSQVRASRVQLTDEEMVNFDAEIKVRKLMQQDAAAQNLPREAIYWWPFPNGGGGIVIGEPMTPNEDHPAREYDIEDLNLGQSNNPRYAQFVANNPNHPLIAVGDQLVNDYTQVNHPHPQSFPEYEDLEGFQVYILNHRDADGRPTISLIDFPEDWEPEVSFDGVPLQRRRGQSRNPQQPTAQLNGMNHLPQVATGWNAAPAPAHAPGTMNLFGGVNPAGMATHPFQQQTALGDNIVRTAFGRPNQAAPAVNPFGGFNQPGQPQGNLFGGFNQPPQNQFQALHHHNHHHHHQQAQPNPFGGFNQPNQQAANPFQPAQQQTAPGGGNLGSLFGVSNLASQGANPFRSAQQQQQQQQGPPFSFGPLNSDNTPPQPHGPNGSSSSSDHIA